MNKSKCCNSKVGVEFSDAIDSRYMCVGYYCLACEKNCEVDECRTIADGTLLKYTSTNKK